MKRLIPIPKVDLSPFLGLNPRELRIIARGYNPFEYSLQKVYAPLRVRRKRIRNPKAKLKILGRRSVKN